MQLTWKNVDIEVKNKNKRYGTKRIKLVSDACGVAQKGLLAIMGPSGSGKTTLLNALAGRMPEGSLTTGQVLIDDVERKFNEWSNRVGYVDQDDQIFEALTVRESIIYAAKFRLKEGRENIDSNVQDLCAKLAITHILECVMKNVSGGERKRAMLAIELITDPEIIFLDEPTSGLDNFTTLNIVKLLKEISKEGKIIIFSIHQPDDLTADLFDDILLLSQGRSVYMGKMAKCEDYLISKGFKKGEKDNFSNLAMSMLSVDPGLYHETSRSTPLNALVEEVKKAHNFTNEKVPRKSNDEVSNYDLNLYHTMLLFKRRIKLQLWSKKNIFTIIITFILVLLGWYLMQSIDNSDSKQEEKGVSESDILSLGNDPINPKIKKHNKLQSMSMVAGVVTGAMFSLCPLTAGVAFTPEYSIIRREMGVCTYSISSYYLSVLLFEYLKCIPILFLFGIVWYYIGTGYLTTLFVVLNLLILIITVPLYLCAGSMFSTMKKVIFLFATVLIANTLPVYFIKFALNLVGVMDGTSVLFMAISFLPHSLLGPCIMASLLSNSINIVKKINEEIDPIMAKHQSYYQIEQVITSFERVLIGFHVPFYCSIIVGIFILVGLVTLTTLRLSSHLMPKMRMALNKKK